MRFFHDRIGALSRPYDPARDWRVRRLLNKHPGQTGLILLGRFFPIRLAVDDPVWRQVRIWLDRKPWKTIGQYSRGPFWIEHEPGEIEIMFQSTQVKLRRRQKIDPDMEGVLGVIVNDLAPGTVRLVGFRPPLIPLIRARQLAEWYDTEVRTDR